MMLFQLKQELPDATQGRKQGSVRFDISAFMSALPGYTGPNPPGAVISIDLMKTCAKWVMDNSKNLDRGYYEIDRKKFGFDKASPGTLRAQVGEKNWEKVKILAETGIRWGEEKKNEELQQKKSPKKPEPGRNLLNQDLKFTEFYKAGGEKTV